MKENSKVRRRPAARAEHPPTSGETEAQREADRIIAARYAPASALINEEMNVLQLRCDTSRYLDQSPRKATRNLLKMAREGLFIALRDAVDKAREDEGPVRREIRWWIISPDSAERRSYCAKLRTMRNPPAS